MCFYYAAFLSLPFSLSLLERSRPGRVMSLAGPFVLSSEVGSEGPADLASGCCREGSMGGGGVCCCAAAGRGSAFCATLGDSAAAGPVAGCIGGTGCWGAEDVGRTLPAVAALEADVGAAASGEEGLVGRSFSISSCPGLKFAVVSTICRGFPGSS